VYTGGIGPGGLSPGGMTTWGKPIGTEVETGPGPCGTTTDGVVGIARSGTLSGLACGGNCIVGDGVDSSAVPPMNDRPGAVQASVKGWVGGGEGTYWDDGGNGNVGEGGGPADRFCTGGVGKGCTVRLCGGCVGRYCVLGGTGRFPEGVGGLPDCTMPEPEPGSGTTASAGLQKYITCPPAPGKLVENAAGGGAAGGR
jgi:hypothetical protein